MTTLGGHYVATFADATHCVASGSLDDPGFRSVAMQRITARGDGWVELETSGRLEVGRAKSGRECVKVAYNSTHDALFSTGNESVAEGYPFRDDKAAAR